MEGNGTGDEKKEKYTKYLTDNGQMALHTRTLVHSHAQCSRITQINLIFRLLDRLNTTLFDREIKTTDFGCDI